VATLDMLGDDGTWMSDFTDKISKSNLETREIDSIISVFNSLDKTNPDDIKNFSNQIKDLGITLKGISYDDFEKLEDDLIKLSGAVKTLDFSKVTKKFSSFLVFLQSINQETPKIKDSTYNEIINLGIATADEFVKNLEGNYVYLSGSLQDLSHKFQNNLMQSIQNTKDVAAAQYAAKATYDQLMGSDNATISNVANVKAIAENLVTRGFDLTKTQIVGLGSDSLTEAEAAGILEKISSCSSSST
jgi:hypothetical protein